MYIGQIIGTWTTNHPVYSDEYILNSVALAMPGCIMPACDILDVVRCMVDPTCGDRTEEFGKAPLMGVILSHLVDECKDYERVNSADYIIAHPWL